MQNPASMGDGRAAVKVSLGVAVVEVLASGLTFGNHEKSPLPRLEKPAGLGNPSPGLTFSW